MRRGRWSGGFEINKRGIERFTRELQKEFDKHPIRVDVGTGPPELPDISHGATVTYNGPVIFGSADGAQLAWNNGAVCQSRTGESQQIAEGFEALANVVAEILRQLPATGLDNKDQALAARPATRYLSSSPSRVRNPARSSVPPPRSGESWCHLPSQRRPESRKLSQTWQKAAIEHLSTLIS